MKTQLKQHPWLVAFAVVALSLALWAQTQTQQTAQRLDSTTKFATSATSAATITISPAANNYIYITQVTIDNCAGTTVTAAAPLTVTSTGLGGGTTPAWTIGTAGTAGMCNPTEGYWGGIPIKSNTPGANVTFVLPTFTANQVVRANVFYYEAP